MAEKRSPAKNASRSSGKAGGGKGVSPLRGEGLLLVNSFLGGKKYEDMNAMFARSAKKLGVSLRVARTSELYTPCGSAPEANADFVLCWDKDLFVTDAFERAGVPVFNSRAAVAACDDKAMGALAFCRAGLRTPLTLIAPKTFSNIGYTDFAFLERAEAYLSYPMVIKHRFGSFGAQVYLASDRESARKILENCGGSEVILQEFISESAGKDLRINVVGGRICGCMLRENPDDFRSNVSSGGHMRSVEAPEEFRAAALAAAKSVGAEFAGVDVLFGKDGPVLCEINASPHFLSTYLASGIDLSYEILRDVCEKVYE